LQALDAIEANPFFGKPLHGKYAGQYSVRVWPYRIIYKIYKSELLILVIEFDHRQGAYK
jgi:mRNA-degrading endonuclease RelE of RelBE toxin-antitoxin system